MRPSPSPALRDLFAAALVGVVVALPISTALVAWRGSAPDPEPVVVLAVVAAPPPAVAQDAPHPRRGTEPVRASGTVFLAEPAAAAEDSEPRDPVVAARVPEPATSGRPDRAGACSTEREGIARQANGSFLLDRQLVDAYARQPAALGHQAGVAWHRGADGRTDGFRVTGIDCGSDLHAAGIRSGDVIHSVNGRPLTTVPQALWAYTSLRRADDLVLRVTRKGKTRSLRYRVG